MTSFNVLQNNLNELSLLKMAEILPNVIDKSVKENISLQDSLLELTSAEIAFRDERARKINVTVSHFPYIKTIKDFDFSYQPTINKAQVMDFMSLRFIESKSNIIQGRKPLVNIISRKRNACQGRRLAVVHFTLDVQAVFCYLGYSGSLSSKKIVS